MKPPAKDPTAVALGRKGGKVGGLARVAKGFAMLTPAERKAVAAAAAKKRWAKAPSAK